ncbi:MAG: hypothetical protein AB1515_02120 [Nitrospirota bacterium]
MKTGNAIRNAGKAAHAMLLAGLVAALAGCASKQLPPLIFPQSLYPADSYPVHVTMAGVTVGLVPFTPGQSLYLDPKRPAVEVAHVPLNILQAGVFPLRIIVTNRRDGEIMVEPSQVFCLSEETPYKTYQPQQAVNLIIKSDVFKEALKGTRVGPLLKSIFGGELLFSAATGGVGGVARGGLTGGVSGVASGATKTAMDRANQYENALTRLLTDQAEMQALRTQTLSPGFTIDGVVYCPSTLPIRALHLTVYDRTNEESIPILSLLPEPIKPAKVRKKEED